MKSLVEQTKALMEALELHYDWDEEDKVFRLDFNTDNTKFFVTIECLEDKGILINHGWLPINLPKEKRRLSYTRLTRYMTNGARRPICTWMRTTTT